MYQNFGAVSELLDSSKFESGAEQRRRLEVVGDTAQALFLHQLAIVQHRSDLRPSSVPEPLRAATARFRATLAQVLLNLAGHVESKPERLMPDLPAALSELEKAVATQIRNVTDTGVAAQIRARLTLYQEAVPFVMKLMNLRIA